MVRKVQVVFHFGIVCYIAKAFTIIPLFPSPTILFSHRSASADISSWASTPTVRPTSSRIRLLSPASRAQPPCTRLTTPSGWTISTSTKHASGLSRMCKRLLSKNTSLPFLANLYTSIKQNITSGIDVFFAAVAFRYGHVVLSDVYHILDEEQQIYET
ncbi:hypothetical protein BC936DRAFT_149893 [Jimgerdemannia flammicorona]|uniref:Uncharacterized protein n=1 Tax=Jimgerdemannia flammicorona TaxID=994334 RepID=A0A433CZW4_9FUNG|nr:hypothetical protein BC936DRAFT_149893 [Jimgerdemannia flammicorona]